MENTPQMEVSFYLHGASRALHEKEFLCQPLLPIFYKRRLEDSRGNCWGQLPFYVSPKAKLKSQSPKHPAPWQVFQGLFFLLPDGAHHRLGQEAEAENAHSAQTWTPLLFQGAVDRKPSSVCPLPPNLMFPGAQVLALGWAPVCL